MGLPVGICVALCDSMTDIGSILLIKPGEGRQVSFFVVLLVCLGAGMAIGRGSADVMFLKRYGIEYLPVMYLILSLVLAVCFILYSAFVDRVSSERFFYFLLSIEVLALLGFWVVIVYTDIEAVYPAYFVFYELMSELILVHATLYIAQSLDTMQSKRLTSLILAGYQLGMIVGGVFFAAVTPFIGVEYSMTVWSVLLFISLVMLYTWHKKHGVPSFYMPPSKKAGRQINMAIAEVSRGLQFVRKSNLLKNSSLALFFMVLMFYVLTYSVNKIYSESFESEAELAMFFGILVAGTNFLAVIMQVFVSARVIEKIGVRKAKLIYPLTSIVSYMLLLISPGFYMALAASVNNSSLMPAFRNPTRQMFFNVLPSYMQGRARATSVAIVLPVALFVCGALLLYLQTSQTPALIIYFGFFCALMYLYFCFCMGKVYSTTLIENLKKKLYLPKEISKEACRGSGDSLYPILLEGLASENDKICMSYAELLLDAYPEESVLPIIQRIESGQASVSDRLIRLIGSGASEEVLADLMVVAEKGDEHRKATVYDVVLEHSGQDRYALIDEALSAQNSRMVVSGIKAAIRQGPGKLYQRGMVAWYEMLQAGWPQQMNVIDMYDLMKQVNKSQREELKTIYTKVFASLLEEEGDARRSVIYKAMSQWSDLTSEDLHALIKQDMKSVDPMLRSSVAACLHLLREDQGRNESIWMMLADGHDHVRKAALRTLYVLYEDPKFVCFEWLLKDGAGAPRAQKVLLEALIAHGIEREKLQQIVDKKTEYAAQLLRALSVLEEVDNTAMEMTRTVIGERLTEMIDLVLLAIETGMEKDSIAVVRAGLCSKDPGLVASAHEVLNGIEDKRLAVLLSNLIERKQNKSTKHGDGKYFFNNNDVLQWCIKFGDAWLRECSRSALSTLSKKVYA